MSNNLKLPFYTQGMPTIKFRQIFVKKKKEKKESGILIQNKYPCSLYLHRNDDIILFFVPS